MFRHHSFLGSSSSTLRSLASGSSDITELNDSLYQFHKPRDTSRMQIVFFHGLQLKDYSKAHLSTWESYDGSCIWPKTWLVEEFPEAHVMSVSYGGGLGHTSAGNIDMYNIGENLIIDMMQAGVGQVPGCPVILVGHSIGGLVIKQLCCHAHEKLHIGLVSDRAKVKNFLDNLKGIFYYATPHQGSGVANKLADRIGTPLSLYFKMLSKDTARLNSQFEAICKEHEKLLFSGLGESLPTRVDLFKSVMIVPEASARYGFGTFNIVEKVDHFSICKPRRKNFRSFSALKDFISNIVTNAEEEAKRQQEAFVMDYAPAENEQAIPRSVVGVKYAVEEIKAKLGSVQMLGLVGMGGIGKTTLAMAVFNQLGPKFEYTCFVHDVKLIKGSGSTLMKEVWSGMHQNGKKTEEKHEVKLLRQRKLLLVLDDIADYRDTSVLSYFSNATSTESRFIVTSRDQELVRDSGADCHKVSFLNEKSAWELFQSYAFPNQGIAPPRLGMLALAVVQKCEGLPLTLEVLGKYLNKKDNEEDWMQALTALTEAHNVRNFEKRLWAKLRLSYDDLGEKEQQMFLDATTFFSGNKNWTLGEAKMAWKVAYDIEYERLLWNTLVDLSLVYDVEENEMIKIHEQLQSLGRKIAAEPENGGKSRVWDGLVGLKLLQKINELDKQDIQGLRVGISGSSNDDIHIASSTLQRLQNLQFLDVNVPIVIEGAQEYESFPTKLVLFKCDASEFAQVLFHPVLGDHLVILKLFRWKNLSLPSSIGSFITLKSLILSSATEMESIPDQFGQLSQLELLELRDCPCLRNLPKTFGNLSNLKYLFLEGCLNLHALPDSFGQLKALIRLKIHDGTFSTLPDSLGELNNLTQLEFWSCPRIHSLPDSFSQLGALQHLNLELCISLCTLPESFGELKALSHLQFQYCYNLQSLPDSFGQLKTLRHLQFGHCYKLLALPESFGELSALDYLGFECSNLHTLPESFGRLRALDHLEFDQCAKFSTLPESFGQLQALARLSFNCENLHSLPESFGQLKALCELKFLHCEKLDSLPESFGQLEALRGLEFISCENLQTLPQSFFELDLSYFHLQRCESLLSFISSVR